MISPSLIPRPFEEEEKGPGTHCMRMREVYGAFSSIYNSPDIVTTTRSDMYGQRIPSISWHPKSMKPTDWIFHKNILRKTFFALI